MMLERKKIPSIFFYLLFVFVFLLFLGALGVLRPIRGLMEKNLFVPFRQELYDWQRKLGEKPEDCQLKSEAEIAALKAKIASLVEENTAQKRLLSAPLPKDWQFLPVRVIGLENETLTIDSGAKEGVQKGMVAVWGENYLGKVSEVSENLAQIRLSSFFEEKLVVRIVGEKDKAQTLAKGLLVGRGQGKMRVEQILASEEVFAGDLVLAPIEGGDLLVGKVEEVIKPEGEVFKTAQVKRLYQLDELVTIFLIRGRL